MNILFLSIGKLDDINERGIYTDLLRQFRDNGHNVYVVTPREKRLNLPTEYTLEDGVRFLRVKTGNITKTNVLEKGISTIMIETIFLRLIKKHLSNVKFDIVIYSTPPITFERVIDYIKKRDGAKSYLLLKDIFPQNAVDLGMLSKKSPIYCYFRRKEKKLYRSSDYIGCMSPANVDYILKHNPEIPSNIVEVCPNSLEPLYVDLDEEEICKIRTEYNIPCDKTVFIYGGNLGKPQGVDFLVECLKVNNKNNDIYSVIAGSGTDFNKLKKFFDKERPGNAQLLYRLPKSEFEDLVGACDVGLIFLDKRFTIPNFPSRLLSYMQASIPVLAATDACTDIGKLIEKEGFGYWCESDNVNVFNKNLQLLCDKRLREKMGINARRCLENHFTAQRSFEIIKKHF